MKNIAMTLATLTTLTLTLPVVANAAAPAKTTHMQVCVNPADDFERRLCETAKYIEAENKAGRTWSASKDGIRVSGVKREDCARFAKVGSQVLINGRKMPSGDKAAVGAACAKPKNTIHYPN